ncbi:glycoside hydrolase family 32 protein [Eupransor demetentiae]|uniref:GH32 family (SacC) n=1 Tax=Eupransor demetentiae TaxID=3109584 RepID=A0ABP0ER59_9LACO|nr:GH32 family (SacC) [Lactobacillaceae bacterium LMG 33000]
MADNNSRMNLAEMGTFTSNELSQKFHLNTKHGWSNDLQTMVWNEAGQYYDVYFLHSVEGPERPFGEQGQDWFHATTKDFLHFSEQNIAIPAFGPKGEGSWRSAWTGTVIRNKNNQIKGVPDGALVAYFSGLMQGDPKLNQHIWAAWSDDNGQTFANLLNDGQPVLSCDWDYTAADDMSERDPGVMYWNDRLIMYTSEDKEIAVFQSEDGIEWRGMNENPRLSKIAPAVFFAGHKWTANAQIECPVLRPMVTPDGQEKVVLFFAAKEEPIETTGSYYAVGTLNKHGMFQLDEAPRRLDAGSDFYGVNYTGSDDLSKPDKDIVVLGWTGNWNYAAAGIHLDQGGQSKFVKHWGPYSTPRRLTLNNDLTISSEIMLNLVYEEEREISAAPAESNSTDIPDLMHKRYEIKQDLNHSIYNLKIQAAAGKKVEGTVSIRFEQGKDFAQLDFDPKSGTYHVMRMNWEFENDNQANHAFDYYSRSYTVQSDAKELQSLNFEVITDQASIEFILPDGSFYTLSRFCVSDKQDLSVSLADDSLESTLTAKVVKPFN